MRIGIDISRIATANRTGTEHYTYELLAGMARLDRANSYTLYCNAIPAALPPLEPNFTLRPIPMPRLWTHTRLSAEVALHPPDVVFIPAHVVPPGALFRNTRVVVTIHDMGYIRFPAAHTRAQRLYLRLSTAWSTWAADRIIAISGATRADLVQLLRVPAHKISVIHHGVARRFQPVSDWSALLATLARYGLVGPDGQPIPYFFYVGTLQPRKNLIRLIDALAQVQGPHLVIAGKTGWLAEGIQQHAEQLGIAKRVHFSGYVADTDLPALLSGALAFTLPSLYEGFGMPVLEAMACGAAVLASNTSAIPEVAGDAALLVDPLDTAAIANGLMLLAGNPQLRQELRERGLKRAAHFTWDRCTQETLEVLREF